MKQQSTIFYLLIGAVSYILSNIFIGPKYGIYDYFPSYYLFEMPNDAVKGNLYYEFSRWFLFCVISVIISFIINSTNKKQGFNFIKEIKKKNYIFVYSFLIMSLGLPLLTLLMDYISLSIGTIGKGGRIFPYGYVIFLPFWLYFLFYIYKNAEFT